VALVTYPGSGNTWTRHLIEGLSGIFTGSALGEDHELIQTFSGEREDHELNTTFVIKTHKLNVSFVCNVLQWNLILSIIILDIFL